MVQKGTVADPRVLYHANLAVMAELGGNYEDAVKQWRRASVASLRRDCIVLYEEAAKRCERRLAEQFWQTG
jgi:hypothetical protein